MQNIRVVLSDPYSRILWQQSMAMFFFGIDFCKLVVAQLTE
jgi:hypothetical protein